jgi:hypothetical protein
MSFEHKEAWQWLEAEGPIIGHFFFFLGKPTLFYELLILIIIKNTFLTFIDNCIVVLINWSWCSYHVWFWLYIIVKTKMTSCLHQCFLMFTSMFLDVYINVSWCLHQCFLMLSSMFLDVYINVSWCLHQCFLMFFTSMFHDVYINVSWC